MICVSASPEKCTSFNHYPAERKCCITGGHPGYGAIYPNPHPGTGHITYIGTMTEGNITFNRNGESMLTN